MQRARASISSETNSDLKSKKVCSILESRIVFAPKVKINGSKGRRIEFNKHYFQHCNHSLQFLHNNCYFSFFQFSEYCAVKRSHWPEVWQLGSSMYVSRVIRDIIDDMLWYLPDNLIQIRIFNEVFPRVMGFMSKIFMQ